MSTLLSVDLDDVACYHEVYGLDSAPTELEGAMLERALPRFLDLFARLEVRATFFVIGRDLERDLMAGGKGAVHLRRALAEGHELANHSYAHAYDFIKWSAKEISADLRRCDALLRQLGTVPVGFRAPGYLHDEKMLLQAAGLGYRYDSSLLPSPSYWAAKQGARTWMRLRGRDSRSMGGYAGSFVGSPSPTYLPQVGLWEVPMSVSPGLRLPLIGTSLLGGPEALRRQLVRQAESLSYFHLELHAIDLADAEADGIEHLVKHSPGLGIPLETRRERLESLIKAREGGGCIARALVQH